MLFLCRANSCRSQIAEGLARSLLPKPVAVYSAGSRPTHVDPRAIECLDEIGIDISGQRSKSIDDVAADQVDLVITLCAEGEADCPVFHGDLERHYWPLPDPAAARGTADEVMKVFRQVREELADRIGELAADS